MCFDLASCDLVEITSSSFEVFVCFLDSLGFSMQTAMSYAHKGWFYFFAICMPFICFSCLNTVAGIFALFLNLECIQPYAVKHDRAVGFVTNPITKLVLSSFPPPIHPPTPTPVLRRSLRVRDQPNCDDGAEVQRRLQHFLLRARVLRVTNPSSFREVGAPLQLQSAVRERISLSGPQHSQ